MERLSTGISGFDTVLNGGLLPNRTYLVRGGPGTGKTTLGLHFLIEENPNSLLITLMEPKQSLVANAQNLGLCLENIDILDMSPGPEAVTQEPNYQVFPSNETEKPSMLKQIVEKIKDQNPDRIFIDGLKHLKHLAEDSYQYRKQVLSLIKLAIENGATILISSEAIEKDSDEHLQFIVDGIIELTFSHESRFMRVTKLRGGDFQNGQHAVEIDNEGMTVYPKFLRAKSAIDYRRESLSSGVPELDELLHGGIERGTDTIISGSTGVGKTSLGLQFVKESAGRGERSVIYTFEEGRDALLNRAQHINIPVKQMHETGSLSLVKINPFKSSPEQFANGIYREVKDRDAKTVMIDSLNSYFTIFESPNHTINDLIKQLHYVSEYLKNRGVTIIKVVEISSVTGDFIATEHGASYLADNIIFLRFFESRGRLHKAVGVLKKRLSSFENTLREFEITRHGIKVGQPLETFEGILTGNPRLSESREADQKRG